MSKKLLIIALSALFLSGCSASQKINTQSVDNADNQDILLATSSSLNDDINESSIDEATAALDKACECEMTFKEPYPIDWSGSVMAVFSSGDGIGVKRFDQNAKYKQFMVRTEGLYNGEGENVRIKGKMVGITCAYYNTIFGECVPDVIAESIQNIK